LRLRQRRWKLAGVEPLVASCDVPRPDVPEVRDALVGSRERALRGVVPARGELLM